MGAGAGAAAGVEAGGCVGLLIGSGIESMMGLEGTEEDSTTFDSEETVAVGAGT